MSMLLYMSGCEMSAIVFMHVMIWKLPLVLAGIREMRAASRKKVPNDGLSRCHTERRMFVCGRARPSFGMTPTLKRKKM